jgi:hypothetical protein
MRRPLVGLQGVAATEYENGRDRLAALAAWWVETADSHRNEATTRLHLIDELLVRVLDWPKDQILAEESYGGTYADYSLGSPATRLIVEAKKEDVYFELPVGVSTGVVGIKTLFDTSSQIEAAIRQALTYCQERGVRSRLSRMVIRS